VSIGCESPEVMCEQLDAILSGRYAADAAFQREKDCVIAEWFHARDGLAHERVGEVVQHAVDDWGARRVDAHACRRFMYALYRDERQARPHPSNHVRHALGLSPQWSFRQRRAVPLQSWLASDKAFTVREVGELTERVRRAYRGGERDARPVEVRSSRDAGCYSHARFLGHSVTLSCA
jgi:hypothetical protein